VNATKSDYKFLQFFAVMSPSNC